MKRLIGLVFLLVSWSAIIFHSINLKCNESKTKFTSQPLFEDGAPSSSTKYKTTISSSIATTKPSYLQWNTTQPNLPNNWSFKRPRFCKNITSFQYKPTIHDKQKIIIHYHMQHNAGTYLWGLARQFVPCALRACWQHSKHCMISYKEETEADNIRANYKKFGMQYVSYEMMLPPHFPMPFISEDARENLFFTTIVRDPFKRFLTGISRIGYKEGIGSNADSPFWNDLKMGQHHQYAADNLNVRWLSGATEQTIRRDQINIAKCRLQLFDLVIADKLYDYATKKVLCPLNNWKGKRVCGNIIKEGEHKSSSANVLNETDIILIGAWIERLRPSFEIYDYARLLSWKQLKDRGVEDLPELSEVPSYLSTLATYMNMTVTEAHFDKVERIRLDNIEQFHPPVEFCNEMKQIWTHNIDEIPNVDGIGTIRADGKLPGHFIYTDNV